MSDNRTANQQLLERCILNLATEFLEEPFIFFNEADAVTGFHQLLAQEPALSGKLPTQDGHEVSRIHREYPIPPFVQEKGNYDTIILKPEYTLINRVDNIARPGSDREPLQPENGKPFLAVVEFKLLYESLGGSRPNEIIKDLNRLNSSAKYSEFVYFVYLQRYLKKNLNQWNKNWPRVREKIEETKDNVGAIVAMHWREQPEGAKLYQFGQWLQS